MNPEHPFDPESFRSLGHRQVDLLADYLARAEERSMPVLSPKDPQDLLDSWQSPLPRQAVDPGESPERLLDLLREVLTHATHVHHPGYIGHQVAVPLPAAALVELTNALLNNGMAVYEMGQLATVLEQRVIDHLASAIGYGPSSGGVLTHGGSLGNLTALLAARQAQSKHDVWTEGQREPLALLVSDQAHYCVARSVQIMGWGSEGAWKVRSDGQGRLDPEDLPRAHRAAEAAGRRVIAVVASCCSTATGSFDPIPPLADYCEAEGLWLHVDGAHGASLVLSPTHRHRLAGIERADSVVWDLHKLMGLPALSTAVLFREARRSYESFAQEAGYLFDRSPPEDQWFNLGQRTLECTKRGMGVTAYAMFDSLGTEWFGQQVDRLLSLTSSLEDMLGDSDDFEIACPAQANILCFRHRPQGLGPGPRLDVHQASLRSALVDSGTHYIVQARLGGELWLRVTVMNPLTGQEDLEGLLTQLRELGGSG